MVSWAGPWTLCSGPLWVGLQPGALTGYGFGRKTGSRRKSPYACLSFTPSAASPLRACGFGMVWYRSSCFHDADEQIMLAQAGVATHWLPWLGGAEIIFGLLVVGLWRWRGMFLLQITMMLGALGAVAIKSPAYLSHAFNPVTLNLLVAVTAAVGWIASNNLPSATRCLRKAPLQASNRKENPA